MPQGDIQLRWDDVHADFDRDAPRVIVTGRIKRIQVGETLTRTVKDAQGQDVEEQYTERTSMGTVQAQVTYPTPAAYWAAGAAVKTDLIAALKRAPELAEKAL